MAVPARPPKDLCVFCFGVRYLHERDAEKLDYENEVEGLVAALEANGYTGLSGTPRETFDALLLEHADAYNDADEDAKRTASIITAALERTWERSNA